MDIDRQVIADQILQAIDYGKLPQHEIERRLNQILEKELTISPSSEESLVRIDLCNSLLWQLSNQGECNYQEHLAKRKEVVSQKYQFYKRRKAMASRCMKVTAAILVIVLGFSAVNLLPRINWYSGNSTEDEQQYIIAGREISFQQVSMALAAQPDHLSLTTESAEEISELLELPIFFPNQLGEDFIATKYYLSSSKSRIDCVCTYTSVHSHDERIGLHLSLFQSIGDIYTQLEQEKAGDIISVQGYQLYRSDNLQVVRYIWLKDNVIFELTFNPKHLEDINIIQQILNEE